MTMLSLLLCLWHIMRIAFWSARETTATACSRSIAADAALFPALRVTHCTFTSNTPTYLLLIAVTPLHLDTSVQHVPAEAANTAHALTLPDIRLSQTFISLHALFGWSFAFAVY